jgi:hypothetical protein
MTLKEEISELRSQLASLKELCLDKGALREAQLQSKEDRKLAERQRVRALVSDHEGFDPAGVDGREAINLASRGEVIELLLARPELTDSVINTRRHDKSIILAAIAPAPKMVRVSVEGSPIECKERYSEGKPSRVISPHLMIESVFHTVGSTGSPPQGALVELAVWKSMVAADPRLRSPAIKVVPVPEDECRRIAARSSYYNPPSVARIGY